MQPAQRMLASHDPMDLNLDLVITQPHVTEISVTDLVIKAAEKMGYEQGFPVT